MRKFWTGLCLPIVAVAGIAHAQAKEVKAEAIPQDAIALYAPFAVQLLQQQFPNPPVKVDPEPTKALGYYLGTQKVAVLVMPDKNFSPKTVGEVKDTEVPVGVVATPGLTLTDKDTLVPADKVATADFNNGQLKLPLFFLAVKGEGESRSLQVYSKDAKALMTVPLKKQEGEQKPADETTPAVGLKLDKIDVDKKTMEATLSLTGGYESTVKLAWLPG